MTLEEWLLYYFFKIPPCGFTHQTGRFVFCQPIVRMALSQVPEPRCLLTRAASMEHNIYPNMAIGLAVPAGSCACAVLQAQKRSQAAPGLPGPRVISSSRVSEPLWLSGDWETRLGRDEKWSPRSQDMEPICRIGPDPATSQTAQQKALALLFGHLLPAAKCAERDDNEVLD